LFDLLEPRRQFGVTPPSDEHVRALADELLRRRRANPAIVTGHECDLALELPHVSISLVVLVSHRVESRTNAQRPYRCYRPGSRTIVRLLSLQTLAHGQPIQKILECRMIYMCLHTINGETSRPVVGWPAWSGTQPE
jgi:hypothetical protein